MPEDLKEHFRYPQDLFELQSKVLTKYHVDDPIKLFTEEDLWDRSLDVVKHGGENLSQGDEGNLFLIRQKKIKTMKLKMKAFIL